MQQAIFFKFTWTYHHTQAEASDLDLVWKMIKQLFISWSLCTLKSAKKVSFTAFPLGKLWQASTNLKVIFTSLIKFWMSKINTVKPLLSGHLRDLPKCLLKRGCRLNRGRKNWTMYVNDQHLTVTLFYDKSYILLKKLSRVQVHYLSLPTLICLYMQKH